MAKPTGFMDYQREENIAVSPKKRIQNFNEFHIPLDKEERKKQGARCMDCGVPFCQSGMMIGGAASGCPLNNLIPEWNDLIYLGKDEKALERLLRTSSFPEFTSRVCPALCEAACTCGLVSNPVTVKENEYYIIENAFQKGLMVPQPPQSRTGKTVAVVGSGPAGLAAADMLNKMGHTVTVYEREDRVGGLLMYGIPNMKLEKSTVARRQKLMEAEGITFITSTEVGRDISAEDILEQYDAVILACGASVPRDIKAPGREAKGIYFAVDYLKGVTKNLFDSKMNSSAYVDAKYKNVIVIGGGDTGNDCVGSAIRQGAKSVLQLEMMPKAPDHREDNNPWPQWPRISKTDYGQEEAIAIFGHDPRVYQTTVKSFIADEEGNLSGAILISLEPVTDKNTGRTVMAEVKGSERAVDAELILIAAGFLGAEAKAADAFGVKLDGRNNVLTEQGRFLTSNPKVFAAGDMHRGQSLVVWAIREGRDCAKEVSEFLMKGK